MFIDELGGLTLDQSSANWIVQVVGRRYEKQSPIVLTRAPCLGGERAGNRGSAGRFDKRQFRDHHPERAFVDECDDLGILCKELRLGHPNGDRTALMVRLNSGRQLADTHFRLDSNLARY